MKKIIAFFSRIGFELHYMFHWREEIKRAELAIISEFVDFIWYIENPENKAGVNNAIEVQKKWLAKFTEPIKGMTGLLDRYFGPSLMRKQILSPRPSLFDHIGTPDGWKGGYISVPFKFEEKGKK